jgi:hypothetical protein
MNMIFGACMMVLSGSAGYGLSATKAPLKVFVGNVLHAYPSGGKMRIKQARPNKFGMKNWIFQTNLDLGAFFKLVYKSHSHPRPGAKKVA